MISVINVVKQILQSMCWNVTLSSRLFSALHAVGCCIHRDQQGAASSHWAVIFLHWHLLSVESRHRAAGWHTVSCRPMKRGKKSTRPGSVRSSPFTHRLVWTGWKCGEQNEGKAMDEKTGWRSDSEGGDDWGSVDGGMENNGWMQS